MLGYDERRVSSLGADMVMYLGELAANTILDTEDNNISTELEQYSTKADRSNVISMMKVGGKVKFILVVYDKTLIFLQMVMERSSSRGEHIKSSLLDPNLTDKMIQQLSDKTGDRQMKNSF